ncbi:MAG: T9SS type A sorting domain-containing protein [Ignavibacteriaceae bacterium]|nr:T9SS type A sorting domain-containing protein [Ignavibacteriaceae bacterium]
MIRRFTAFTLISLLLTTVVYSQTMKLTTYGVSPREANLNATDIFTVQYNGLKNVGVNSKIYLKATLSGARLNAPVFSIVEKPAGSAAAYGGTINGGLDSSSTVIPFTPDVVGKYILRVKDGSYQSDIIINAAKYVGVEKCKDCHKFAGFGGEIVEAWEKTGHANQMKEAFNGEYSSHFQEFCLACHATGYDKKAANDGFDDFPFVYPAVLAPGVYDQTAAMYPEAMKLANVQCEACHGPGSVHAASPLSSKENSKISVTMDSQNCAYCHDNGAHHVFAEQWDYSAHANPTSYPAGPGRESCVRCHTGSGFKQFVDGVPTTSTDPTFDAISCASCHEPHSNAISHQLRKASVKLGNGEIVNGGGNGRLCMNCHQSRQNAATYTVKSASHYGPHYATQADVLVGTNVVTWGATIPNTKHFGVTEDACVTCHMFPDPAGAAKKAVHQGAHTFSMRDMDTGVANMDACATCHGNSLGLDFHDVNFFYKGTGDHDGDGVTEGLQAEVHGLIEKVSSLLPNPDPHAETSTAWTKVQLEAAYNIRTIYYDNSWGIHNPKFTIALLNKTWDALNGITDVDENELVPTEFTVYQNYPNPFNPTTNIKFSIPKASNVKVIVYDAIGREVRQLVNNELNAGTHTIQFNASNLASGIYLYRIEAGDFTKVNKMLLIK